ncbi:MAG: AMP-binding protein [Streptomyces sp.]|nr:AMP-binding protein [Streptomyces sp.]
MPGTTAHPALSGGPAADPAEIFSAATIPEALRLAGTTGRGVTLVDHGLNSTFLGYKDLHEAAGRVADALRRKGIAPGDRVCVLSSTSAEMLSTLYGVWWAGAVPVILPLPGRGTPFEEYFAEVLRRMDACRAALLVAADDLVQPVEDVLPRSADGLAPVRVSGMRPLVDHSTVMLEPAIADPAALALLQFTSGTTGASKAVMLTHGQILGNMAGLWVRYGIGPQDVGYTWLPLNHDMGLIGMLGGMAGAISMVMQPPEDFIANPMSWPSGLSRFRATLCVAPNFAYALAGRLLGNRADGLDLSALRVAMNGAEPIDPATLGRFARAAAPAGFRENALCPMYGLAEGTLAVTVTDAGTPMQPRWYSRTLLETEGRAEEVPEGAPDARCLVPCGRPIPGVTLTIRNEQGDVLDDGEVGEICVSGPTVMHGYWQDPEATREATAGGALHTGDLGFLSADGLVICGRRKDVIILNGRNLYPEDFETHTERVQGIRLGSAVAFALPEQERMVVVAETPTRGEKAEAVAASVLDTLRRGLTVAPQHVLLVKPGAIPKTTSGKRQRRLCRERYLAGELAGVGAAGTAPTLQQEKVTVS